MFNAAAMFRSIPAIIFFSLLSFRTVQAQLAVDSRALSADIVRIISKDLFDMNSLPFTQPMVETFNAASNAGMYGTAPVPAADTFYIRVGIAAMAGLVSESRRSYQPGIPTEPTENEVADAFALLIANKIKEIFKRGVEEDSIRIPGRSGTILGNRAAEFHLNNDYLRREIRKDTLYRQAILLGLDSTIIDDALAGLPAVLSLPAGADISAILALVPQVEIGALYGTELLLRFIPPITLDTNIGRFSFFGAGLRHNVSRYLTRQVDLTLLVGFQHMSLTNNVGVTNARLEANGSTFSSAIRAGKRFGPLSLYGGAGLQLSEIAITYRYTLPRQIQAQLQLITPIDLNGDGRIEDDEYVPDPENGFPGDTKPQTSRIRITDAAATLTFGAVCALGPVNIFADFNLGSFSILSGGITVNL